MVMLVFKLDVQIRRFCRFALLVKKYSLNGLAEDVGNLKGQRQTRVILARFNSVDGAASNAYLCGELGLGPFFLCA